MKIDCSQFNELIVEKMKISYESIKKNIFNKSNNTKARQIDFITKSNFYKNNKLN